MNVTEEKKRIKAKLQEFLEAWKKGDMEAMHKASQITFQDNHPPTYLRYLSQATLSKYKTRKMDWDGAVCDVTLEAVLAFKGKEDKARITLRMVCEDKPYSANVMGTWGVNPISIKEHEV